MSQSFGTEPLPVEQRAALALRLRGAFVRDVAVMGAFERVPREFCASFSRSRQSRHGPADRLRPDMPAPADLARRIDALAWGPSIACWRSAPAPVTGRRSVVSGQEVVSVERSETLAIEASGRLSPLAIHNAQVLCEDGLAPARSMGLLDRIIMHLSVGRPADGGSGPARARRRHGVRGLSRERARPAPAVSSDPARALREWRDVQRDGQRPLPLERRHRRAGAFFVGIEFMVRDWLISERTRFFYLSPKP